MRMWRTNLAVSFTVLGTLGVYTTVANLIPQVQSEVPKEVGFGTTASEAELVSAGEEIYHGAGGCTACHGLGTRAPDLLGSIGRRCAERKPGVDCKTYLYESLTEPTAYVVEGFQPIMPDMRRTLSEPQIWALVAFLESQGGEVTVTADDYASAAEGEAEADTKSGVSGSPPLVAGSPDDPETLLRNAGCTACHRLGEEGGAVGPPFEKMAGLDAGYIRRSILHPAADTAAGFEAVAGTMPMGFGSRFTAAQLEAIVEYLRGAR